MVPDGFQKLNIEFPTSFRQNAHDFVQISTFHAVTISEESFKQVLCGHGPNTGIGMAKVNDKPLQGPGEILKAIKYSEERKP